MTTKQLATLNSFSVIFMLAINYYSQAFDINGNSVGELSDRYANLFTPAGYAFSIWGIIFIGLLVSIGLQLRDAFTKSPESDYIHQMGYWFSLANIFTGLWVIVWLYEFTGLSLIVMSLILVSLLMIILRTNMERWDAPVSLMIRLWWPICLFSGWISVALIANSAAYLAKLGWDGGPLSETSWTVIMIFIATILNIFMIITRNMREFSAVGVWALIAIYVRHEGVVEHLSIAYSALAGAIIIGLVSLAHAFKNRKTLPFLRQLYE